MEIAVSMAPIGPPEAAQVEAAPAPEEANQEPFGQLLEIVLAALVPAGAQAPPVPEGEVAALGGVASELQPIPGDEAEGAPQPGTGEVWHEGAGPKTEDGTGVPARPAEGAEASSGSAAPARGPLPEALVGTELQPVASSGGQDSEVPPVSEGATAAEPGQIAPNSRPDAPGVTLPEGASAVDVPDSVSASQGAADGESEAARQVTRPGVEMARTAPAEQVPPTTVAPAQEGARGPQVEFAQGVAPPEAAQRDVPAEGPVRPGLQIPGVDSRGEEFPVEVEFSRQIPVESNRRVGPEGFRMPGARVPEVAPAVEALSVEPSAAEAARVQPNAGAEPQLLSQAMTAVRLALHNARHTARMLLRPPHLGELRVEITVEDGRVNAVFRAGTESVRLGLLQGMEQLKASIEEHGVRVESIVVSVDAGAGRFAQGSAGEQEPGGEFLLPPAMPKEPEAVQEEGTLVAARSGLLDVIV